MKNKKEKIFNVQVNEESKRIVNKQLINISIRIYSPERALYVSIGPRPMKLIKI